MLDVNLIRAEPEAVRRMLANRNLGADLLDRFLELDAEWRELTNRGNALRKRRNAVSQEIPKLPPKEKEARISEMRAVSEEIKSIEARVSDIEGERDECVLNIPNMPHPTVPVGKDADDNVVVLEWGERREFDFKPLEHFEIGENLDIIDFVRGAKVAGSGFYVLKGDGARLERSLVNYFLDRNAAAGYRETFPPAVVNTAAVTGTGQYPNLKDDMYHITRDDLWLNPTAEVPITNLHREEILEKADLPMKYTAYLPSFRREAGRHSDTRGIIRVHEFNKVELVHFVEPDGSFDVLEDLRAHAESLVQGLGLPYRVLLLCTGDLGFSAAKCYDLELYAPGKDAWLEASSCSCFSDFQARRARVKYREEAHLKSEFVHTLNGSGLALPRTMVAILENCQNKDGTITVPKALVPYMGKETIGN
ncbi:MAG: serine--tRNA ligase [Thermoplasmatales archaeon]|nr:serine--tRNA ligase [Thermoplasmatales archaeon]